MFLSSLRAQRGSLFRICRFNQCHFLRTGTRLELLFAADGLVHGCVQFKINQRVNAVLLSEAIGQIILVLPHACGQVGRHANIQRAMRLVGQDERSPI